MKEPKYKIGQKVYRLRDKKVVFEPITAISNPENTNDMFYYGFDTNKAYYEYLYANFAESEIFATKEEIIEYITNNIVEE